MDFRRNKIVPQINKNLSSDVGLGMLAGVMGIIGYGIFLNNLGWHFICFSFIFAAACYISGFFLGILFGIPKRQNIDSKADYSLNNNLADISDWLTKIIIGLGLIELKKIPGYLSAAGDYVMNAIDSKQPSLKLFAICCIVYFVVFGLYYGYCFMRLYLSGQIKEADNDLLEKAAELAKEKITPDDTDPELKKKYADYNEQLKSSKKEEDYTFEDWYYKGIDNYNNKEYEKTIACMKNALTKRATTTNAEADANLYIGISYVALGLFEKGIEQYNKIISIYNAYNNLYIAYYNKGVALNSLNRYDEAMQANSKAIELKPNYANAWGSKSFTLNNLKRYDEALAAANKSIELNSKNEIAWNNKSVSLIRLERYDEALTTVNISIELKPDYEVAWYNKSIVLNNLKRYDEALAAVNKAIELKPDYANAWNNKSFTLNKLKRYDKGLAAANKSIELKPDDAITWNNKSIALINLKQNDDALLATDEAIKLKPDYELAWYNKSIALNNLKRYDEALTTVNKAIELKPEYANAWNNKSVSLINLKQYDEALVATNKAIELKPDYSNAYYNRARSYAGLNNKENMLLDLKKAIELDPKWKKSAKANEIFKAYLEDADFKQLTD
jgi:tetratricopeptide (TPR) repeat protein